MWERLGGCFCGMRIGWEHDSLYWIHLSILRQLQEVHEFDKKCFPPSNAL